MFAGKVFLFSSMKCTIQNKEVRVTFGVILNLSHQPRTGVLSLPLRIGLLLPRLRPENGAAPLQTGLKRSVNHACEINKFG